eukprot:6208201-Pleurochrysis_carterae.AAC.3
MAMAMVQPSKHRFRLKHEVSGRISESRVVAPQAALTAQAESQGRLPVACTELNNVRGQRTASAPRARSDAPHGKTTADRTHRRKTHSEGNKGCGIAFNSPCVARRCLRCGRRPLRSCGRAPGGRPRAGRRPTLRSERRGSGCRARWSWNARRHRSRPQATRPENECATTGVAQRLRLLKLVKLLARVGLLARVRLLARVTFHLHALFVVCSSLRTLLRACVARARACSFTWVLAQMRALARCARSSRCSVLRGAVPAFVAGCVNGGHAGVNLDALLAPVRAKSADDPAHEALCQLGLARVHVPAGHGVAEHGQLDVHLHTAQLGRYEAARASAWPVYPVTFRQDCRGSSGCER